jgi:hypothetical protein
VALFGLAATTPSQTAQPPPTERVVVRPMSLRDLLVAVLLWFAGRSRG